MGTTAGEAIEDEVGRGVPDAAVVEVGAEDRHEFGESDHYDVSIKVRWWAMNWS